MVSEGLRSEAREPADSLSGTVSERNKETRRLKVSSGKLADTLEAFARRMSTKLRAGGKRDKTRQDKTRGQTAAEDCKQALCYTRLWYTRGCVGEQEKSSHATFKYKTSALGPSRRAA